MALASLSKKTQRKTRRVIYMNVNLWTTAKMLTAIIKSTIYKLKTGHDLLARTCMSKTLRQSLGRAKAAAPHCPYGSPF